MIWVARRFSRESCTEKVVVTKPVYMAIKIRPSKAIPIVASNRKNASCRLYPRHPIMAIILIRGVGSMLVATFQQLIWFVNILARPTTVLFWDTCRIKAGKALAVLREFPDKMRALARILAVLLAFLGGAAAFAESWPEIYDPFRVRTLYLQMESGSSWGAVVSDGDFDNPQNAQFWIEDEAPIAV